MVATTLKVMINDIYIYIYFFNNILKQVAILRTRPNFNVTDQTVPEIKNY